MLYVYIYDEIIPRTNSVELFKSLEDLNEKRNFISRGYGDEVFRTNIKHGETYMITRLKVVTSNRREYLILGKNKKIYGLLIANQMALDTIDILEDYRFLRAFGFVVREEKP